MWVGQWSKMVISVSLWRSNICYFTVSIIDHALVEELHKFYQFCRFVSFVSFRALLFIIAHYCSFMLMDPALERDLNSRKQLKSYKLQSQRRRKARGITQLCSFMLIYAFLSVLLACWPDLHLFRPEY